MEDKTYTSGTLQYIPFFYVIWSDDLVSASEVNVVQKAIDEDESLSAEEKEQLNALLDVKRPPSDAVLKQWRQTISNSKVKLVESDIYPLATFSQNVVCHYKEVCPFNKHLKHIEVNLGMQPNHYHHLFDVEVVQEKTSDFYYAAELDAILKGNTPLNRSISS